MRHGDGLMGMQALGPASVDHVLTDPPYSQWVHQQHKVGGGARVGGGERYKDLGFGHLTPELRAEAARHIARITRRWCLVFCDAEGIAGWMHDLALWGLEHVRVGAWIKQGATPQFSGDRPAPGWEAIVVAHRPGRKRWNGGGRHAVWTHPIVQTGRLHTTQKPLGLMEALVRDFTEPGELILDPFAGSGTTGVAAVRHGRRFLGWELQEKYADAARRRLAATQEQMTLGLAAEPA